MYLLYYIYQYIYICILDKDDPIYATAVEKLNQKTQIMNQYRKITNPFSIKKY